MVHDRCSPPQAFVLDDLSLPERFALWALRCVDTEPRLCHTGTRRVPPGLIAELHAVVRAFRSFQGQIQAQGGTGLRMAPWGSSHLNRDERRLLRAVAACQAGQTELADHLLFRFEPRSMVRRGLAQAVAALAATLAAGGYWLPHQAEPRADASDHPRWIASHTVAGSAAVQVTR